MADDNGPEYTGRLILVDAASKKEIDQVSKNGVITSTRQYEATLSTDEGKSWYHVFTDPSGEHDPVAIKASASHTTRAPEHTSKRAWDRAVRQIQREAATPGLGQSQAERQHNQDKVDDAVTKFLYHLERGDSATANKSALQAFKLIQEKGLIDPRLNLAVKAPQLEARTSPRVEVLRRQTERGKGAER